MRTLSLGAPGVVGACAGPRHDHAGAGRGRDDLRRIMGAAVMRRTRPHDERVGTTSTVRGERGRESCSSWAGRAGEGAARVRRPRRPRAVSCTVPGFRARAARSWPPRGPARENATEPRVAGRRHVHLRCGRGGGGRRGCPLSRTSRRPRSGTMPTHAGPRVSASGPCVHSIADRPAQGPATLPENLDVEHATPTTRGVRPPACTGGWEGEGSCKVARRPSPRRSRRGPIEARDRRRCGPAHDSSAHTRRSCWRICPCAWRSANMSRAACTSGSPLALTAGLSALELSASGAFTVCGG